MDSDHQIRLRGPWQLWLLRDDAADSSAETRWEACGRFQAPDGLSERIPEHFCGRARLQRSFHRPTGLDHRSQVHLRVATPLRGQLSLNGHALAALEASPRLVDITARLQTRNRIELEVVIDATTRISQPSCDVRLEILQAR